VSFGGVVQVEGGPRVFYAQSLSSQPDKLTDPDEPAAGGLNDLWRFGNYLVIQLTILNLIVGLL